MGVKPPEKRPCYDPLLLSALHPAETMRPAALGLQAIIAQHSPRLVRDHLWGTLHTARVRVCPQTIQNLPSDLVHRLFPMFLCHRRLSIECHHTALVTLSRGFTQLVT